MNDPEAYEAIRTNAIIAKNPKDQINCLLKIVDPSDEELNDINNLISEYELRERAIKLAISGAQLNPNNKKQCYIESYLVEEEVPYIHKTVKKNDNGDYHPVQIIKKKTVKDLKFRLNWIDEQRREIVDLLYPNGDFYPKERLPHDGRRPPIFETVPLSSFIVRLKREYNIKYRELEEASTMLMKRLRQI